MCFTNGSKHVRAEPRVWGVPQLNYCLCIRCLKICLRKDYKVVVAVVIQRELDKSHKSFEMAFPTTSDPGGGGGVLPVIFPTLGLLLIFFSIMMKK